MNDKVTVVVPVYNVEKYLDRCVESLLHQTVQGYRIILVDDGSMDCSGKKCDDWALKSNIITTFHKQNGGLSDARNYGVQYVDTEYVTFVDSDDYVEPEYIELLLKGLETGADMVVTHHIQEYEDQPQKAVIDEKFNLYSAEEALKKIFPEVANKVSSIHGYYATMAISDRCSFWSIPSAKSTVDERILQRYCYGVDRVISGTKIIPHEHQQILESKLKSRIAFATTSFDIPELQKLINEAFQSLTDLKLEEAYLIPGLAYDFTDCVFSNYSPTDEMRAEKARIFQTIDHCWSLEKITETLKKEISDVVADQERQHRMQTRKPVREAIEYIGNHYKEKITLDSICDQLQMNSSYFSTLFKKETGENFQNYLTNFRIEKAKELLVTTQNTMGAVAAEVGYADVRYFSQCFAKIVGMKPSLYRKMYS